MHIRKLWGSNVAIDLDQMQCSVGRCIGAAPSVQMHAVTGCSRHGDAATYDRGLDKALCKQHDPITQQKQSAITIILSFSQPTCGVSLARKTSILAEHPGQWLCWVDACHLPAGPAVQPSNPSLSQRHDTDHLWSACVIIAPKAET